MTARLNLTVNGEPRTSAAATIAALVGELGLKPEKVAVEHGVEEAVLTVIGVTLVAAGHLLNLRRAH